MKLVFLRGAVPTDRSPKEIMWESLGQSDDMWEHLACTVGDERCEIVYWGGNRIRKYTDKDTVVWVQKTKHYTPDFAPDVVFERGGFDEGRKFTKRYPNAYRIYYGSGPRFLPKNEKVRYDLVLVDSERQLHKARKHGWNAQLWQKPAAPQFKYMPEVAKEYDVCYVAAIPEDDRKNCAWVYKTCPKDLRVLQLGYKPKHLKVPPNFTIKRVSRADMPTAMNQCRVGIVPYTKDDSAPRVMPEMKTSGLPVIVSAEVNQCYNDVETDSLDRFWEHVRYTQGMVRDKFWIGPVDYTIPKAAEHIRGLINAAKNLPA